MVSYDDSRLGLRERPPEPLCADVPGLGPRRRSLPEAEPYLGPSLSRHFVGLDFGLSP